MRRIYRLLALLLFLQSVAIGAAPKAAAAHTELGAVAVFLDSGECGPNARDGEKGPPRRSHAHCCILCSSNCTEKLAFSVAILNARAEIQAPKAAITAAARADGDSTERRPLWTASSSSRGPPRFS